MPLPLESLLLEQTFLHTDENPPLIYFLLHEMPSLRRKFSLNTLLSVKRCPSCCVLIQVANWQRFERRFTAALGFLLTRTLQSIFVFFFFSPKFLLKPLNRKHLPVKIFPKTTKDTYFNSRYNSW